MQEVRLRTSKGQHLFVIDADFCKLCGVSPENYDGVSLFMVSWLALLSDSPLNSAACCKPLKTYQIFLDRIKSHGLKATVIEFANLSHKLMSQHMLMGQSSSIGDWIDDFKDTPVFFEYNRYFKTGDASLLRFLYTFLVFGKKLDYVDPEFETTAFRSWLGIEEKLATIQYSDTDVDVLSSILRIVLPKFSVDKFFPKFGPGSVAERGVRGRISKVELFEYDRVIDRFLYHGLIGKFGYGEDSGLVAEKTAPVVDFNDSDRRASSRVARLMFVPKDLKTSRSICMEPNVLQYYQQGVLSVMMELVGKSQFSKFINLESQERNRRLAYEGSYTSLVDTIDLSSASDCLSYELVKAVFPPSWQIPMRVTRSSSSWLPNGDQHPLKKFAPMGSALCFPTQCILFTSVVVYAACLYTYSTTPYAGTFLEFVEHNVHTIIHGFCHDVSYRRETWLFQPCSVYGDDICVDTRLTPYVMSILDRLGFIVNTTKSFTGSQSFRESCGGFYLDGSDVTPIYYRVKKVNRRRLSAEHLASGIALANAAYTSGYKNLYRCVLRTILYWNCRQRSSTSDKNAILFKEVGSDDFGVIAKCPSNTHLDVREHKDYQRTERKAISITYDYKLEDHNESVEAYEYMRWMASRYRSSSTWESSQVLRSDTGGARLRWRWTPTSE